MAFPIFAAGDVLNASDMNAVGLWLVKTQVIGTTVATVAVTDVFSSTYENYLVTINGGIASASCFLTLQLGSTNTNYYSSYSGNGWNNVAATAGSSNAANMAFFGSGDANTLYANARIFSPNLSKRTSMMGELMLHSTTLGYGANSYGYQDSNTSFTGFTLGTSTGTLTGGTIRVYGMRG